MRLNKEETFVAENCNGDSFVYSIPDQKRIEKQFWEQQDGSHMNKTTITKYTE